MRPHIQNSYIQSPNKTKLPLIVKLSYLNLVFAKFKHIHAVRKSCALTTEPVHSMRQK